MSTRTKKPAKSPLARKPGKAMVILRNVPGGYNWGWFAREDPRMHLQVVDRKHADLGYKVWLEEKGKRVFQPAGEIPAKVLKSLETEVSKQRRTIDFRWTSLMVDNEWVALNLQGSVITVTAYPQFPGSRFTRLVDLAEWLPGIYNPQFRRVPPPKPIQPEEIALNTELDALEIWPQLHESKRHHFHLPPILWQD